MGRTKTEPPTGELPTRTDAQRLLASKQAALAEAERKLAQARSGYDEDAIVEAEARVRALKGILDDLAGRHAAELEDVARERGRRWILARRPDDIVEEIEAAQAKSADAIAAAVEAIRAESMVRERWAATRVGVELLVGRWPQLAAEVPAATVTPPPTSDYAGRVADVAGNVRDTHHRPLLVVGAPASATAAERRRMQLRSLYKVLGRGRAPKDVVEIIELAPQPAELTETPDERSRRERRDAQGADAAERFSQEVAETKRVIDVVPGGFSGQL